MGRPSKDIDLEVFGIDAEALKALLQTIRYRQHRRRELHRLQGRRHRRRAAPPRVEDGPRPSRVRGHRRSATCRPRKPRAGATSPSTRSPGIRSPASTSIRSTAAPTSSAGSCAPSTGRRSATTACACCARCSSRRASSSRSTRHTKELCRRIPLDDLPAERIWGEIEKLLLRRTPAVDRLRARARSRRHRAAVPGARRARRLPTGAGVASRRGRLGPHAAGRSTRRASGSTISPYPQQVVVMLGAVCHDLGKPPTTAFIDGRIRSLDHEEAGRRAGDRAARSAERPLAAGVRRPARSARHRRASSQAGHVSARRSRRSATGRSAGSRRRWISSCSRGSREPTARGAAAGSTARRWTGSSARARELGVEHAPPEPLVKGRHLLALGASPGPALGAGAARGLRASARRTRHDVRRRARAGARDREGEAAILKRMTQERGSRLPRCILAALFSLVPVVVSAQQQEPIAPFVVDLRGSLRPAQGGAERRHRSRRHDRQPADANARLQRRRALLPSASRRRHVRLRRSHGDRARKRDVAARRDDGHHGAVPDGASPFPHDRSRRCR